MELNFPLAVRIRNQITQAIRLRLFLVETGKSKNSISHNQCTTVLEQIAILRSDKQFAQYLCKNYPLIRAMIPSGHEATKNKLIELYFESQKSLGL